jgi:GntR family transcriptional regulator
MVVQRGTPVPPSQQIAAILRAKIAAGDYPPETKIPSILELKDEYEVSPETARKALRILRQEGWVQMVPGYGTFVVKNPPSPPKP